MRKVEGWTGGWLCLCWVRGSLSAWPSSRASNPLERWISPVQKIIPIHVSIFCTFWPLKIFSTSIFDDWSFIYKQKMSNMLSSCKLAELCLIYQIMHLILFRKLFLLLPVHYGELLRWCTSALCSRMWCSSASWYVDCFLRVL